MTTEEKIKRIQDDFSISGKTLSNLLGINLKELETKSPKCVDRLEKQVTFRSDGCITIKVKINLKRYKNIFEAYPKILKEYFDKPWDVYVLAKVKNRGKFSFIGWFFGNNKKAIVNEMNTFQPSYLAKKDGRCVLINFYSDYFTLTEVDKVASEERFVFDGYRYVRANPVVLK